MELWTALAALPSTNVLYWMAGLGILGVLLFLFGSGSALFDEDLHGGALVTANLVAILGVAMLATAIVVAVRTPSEGEMIVDEVTTYLEDTEGLSVLGDSTYRYAKTGGTVTAVAVDDDGTLNDVVVTWLPIAHAEGEDLTNLPKKFEPVTVTVTERTPETIAKEQAKHDAKYEKD